MSFKIIADTFSVSRDSNHFIQTKTLKKPRSDEYVWVAMEVEGEGKYARAASQSIIETLEEVFYDDSDMGPYERFENALKEVNLIIKNLREKHGAKNVGEISAIVAALSANELFLTSSKNAEAYLVRKGKFSLISEGLSGKGDDVFLSIASGDVTPDDKLVFATTRLLRLATHSQLAQVFSDGVSEAMESLRELVMGDEEMNLGVLCIHTKTPQAATLKLQEVAANPVWQKMQNGMLAAMTWVAKKLGNKTPSFNKKGVLAALIVVIALLGISVSVLMESSHSRALREEYRLRIEAMNTDLGTAKTKGYANDKESANAILDKIEEESRDILNSNYFRPEILALMDKVQETRDGINNTFRANALTPYVDLASKRETVEAIGLTNLKGNFFAYEYNALYEIILDQILDPKTIDPSEVVTVGTALEDSNVLVFLTQGGRVIEYSEGQFRFANTQDETWRSGVDVEAYGRFIYILSPNDNQIHKYTRLRDGYSNASDYATGDADLTGAISMAIDGDVYILHKGGEISKLYKGAKQPFQIVNLAADLSDASQIFTTLELSSLYVFDPVHKRVVVAEKTRDGNALYSKQIVFEELEDVKSIYVPPAEDYLYVLTKKAIYRIGL